MTREIIVIGLGPGSPDALSLGAVRAFARLRQSAAPIYARTLRHPIIDWLSANENVVFTDSFDPLYESLGSFDDIYTAIVEALLRASHTHELVGYAVPGHPRFGERAVELLLARAAAEEVAVTIVASASYLDAVLETERGDMSTPLRILDALDLIQPVAPFSPEPEPLDPGSLHVIYQVYDRAIASDLKIALLDQYPPDARVVIVTAAGVAGQETRVERPLAELDHTGIEFNHLTTVLLPRLTCPELFTGYEGLLTIMARLRDPNGGCPWDREQSPETLRRYLLEEAYEVLDAIDSGDPAAYAEELGDLMLQVVFHAQLAREAGEFTLRDVFRAVTAKLVRRHPHVFGDIEADTAEQVLTNWAAIKKTEKGYEDRTSILDGVPREMPALMRAQEISRRAAKSGFEWDSIEGVFDKLTEEIGELRAAIDSGDARAVSDELGDLLFTAVNLARFQKTEAEDALGRMIERFIARFRRIEAHASEQGCALNSLSQAEMERVWQLAKRE